MLNVCHLTGFFSVHINYQALFETRSLIWGEFPTFTCKRGKGEGWWNRMGYTWVGVTWFSVLFYIWFLYMYEVSCQHSWKRCPVDELCYAHSI